MSNQNVVKSVYENVTLKVEKRISKKGNKFACVVAYFNDYKNEDGEVLNLIVGFQDAVNNIENWIE